MRHITRVAVAILVAVVHAGVIHAESATTDSVVEKASHEVSEFLDQFSEVKCTEQVSQSKLSKSGRTEIHENSTYDYFVLLQADNDELTLSESRLAEKKPGNPGKTTPLLLTNGFSTLFLIFHPYYRNGFRFEQLTDEIVNGQTLKRVHFSHIAGTRTPAALAVRGREYPLELVGTAWIDPANGQVARMEASLANSMRDVGLVGFSVAVDYSPVELPGWKQQYRFPSVATVDVESLRQRWRNIHRFTKYKRFMVETQQTIADKGAKD